MRLRETIQRNRELDEELGHAKHLWESANSKLTDELNKDKEEL